MNKKHLSLIVLFGIMLCLGVVFRTDLLNWIENIHHLLRDKPFWWGFLLWPLYLLFSLVGLPVSPLTVLAGTLYGFGFGFFLMSGALFPTLIILIFLTRKFFKASIRRHLDHQPKMKKYLAMMDGSGNKIHFLLRISGWTPFAFLTYLMALSHHSMRRLVIVSVLGTLPHKALQVYMGNMGAQVLAGQEINWIQWLIALLMIVSVFLLVFFTRNELKKIENDEYENRQSTKSRFVELDS